MGISIPCWKKRVNDRGLQPAKDAARPPRSSFSWQELRYLVRTNPMTVIVPLLVFAVAVVVGVFVIRATENARQQTSRTSAQNVALQAAESLQLQLMSLIQPVLALRVLVRQGVHNYTTLTNMFPAMAADLLRSSQGAKVKDLGQQLQLQPQALITDVYPLNDDTKYGLGLDLLDLDIRRPVTLNTMRHNNVTVSLIKFIEGPLAFLIATAVYVDDVPPDYNFSQPMPQSKWCPPDLAYKNTTRSKFWGLVAGAFLMDALLLDPLGPIRQLTQHRYRYQLVQRAGGNLDTTPGYGNTTLLAWSDKSVHKPEKVVIDLDESYKGFRAWELSVSPEGGWESSVEQAMYAVVVIVSAIVAALLCALLISRVQNRSLLFALVPEHVVNTLKSKQRWYNSGAVDVMAAATPAEVLLDLLAGCLEGILPQVATVVQLRAALLSLQDLYRPANMSQALDALNLDDDVAGALMRELQGRTESRRYHHEGDELIGSSLDQLTVCSEEWSMQEVLSSLVTGKPMGHLKKGGMKAGLLGSAVSWGTSTISRSNSVLDGAMPMIGVGARGPSMNGTKEPSVHGATRGKRQAGEFADRIKSQLCMDEPSVHGPGSRTCIVEAEQNIALGEPVWSELHVLLEAGWSSWTWDAFALDDLTQGHALSTLTFFLLHKGGLLKQLGLPQARVARFLHALEAVYLDNSYHNRTHAADVVQTMHVIITKGGMVPGYADPIRHLACLLAAAAHDVEHTGLTNDFLITTEAPLAIRYSDRSPMENHHLATMFTLLKHPDNDFTRGLPKEARETLRKVIIELVLGTDMKQHMTITSQFKSVHQQAAKADRMSMSHGKGPDVPAGDTEERTPLDEAEQMLTLQMALKVADLGSLAESHEVNVRWVDVLEEEFFQQGDQERQLGLPISPLFDRNKPGAAKCQVGFFSFVGLPLFNSFVQVFPDTQPFLDAANANFKYWKSVSAPPVRASQDRASHVSQRAGESGPQPVIQLQSSPLPMVQLETHPPQRMPSALMVGPGKAQLPSRPSVEHSG